MNYNFDEIIDRSCTCDMKWHGRAVSSYLGLPIPEDMIPMWLADTEFACPPIIVDAIKERAAKRIYGYCTPMEDYYQAICRWQERRFGWEISPDWILPIPSVVAGINIAIRAFTTAQDGIIIQQPVYDPFEAIVRRTGRTLVVNQLLEKDGRFEMNWDELERLAADPRNTMMILCSPHNPVGRVWTQEELRRVIDICSRNNVMPVSDEIHSDIVFSGHKHTPLLALDAQTAGRAVLLSAPSKTFNVAGLKMSHAIIPGKSTRDAFLKAQTAYSLDIKNTVDDTELDVFCRRRRADHCGGAPSEPVGAGVPGGAQKGPHGAGAGLPVPLCHRLAVRSAQCSGICLGSGACRRTRDRRGCPDGKVCLHGRVNARKYS